MNQLTAFETLTGLKPYLWQQRLLSQFLAGDVPDALDVPTGLGKTSVIAIWLSARAMGSPLPRRLVYVVDRRAVVDQASGEAERLARNLKTVLGGGLSAPDAAKWRANLGINGGRLPISTLRGQFLDNRLWLEDPTRSAIVVGTVDMIGSRMLFEGYGVTSRMRPVHAALLANDSLIVIDEAHLVRPFHELVRAAARFPRPEPVPPMRVMALSATGSLGENQRVFCIGAGKESEEPRVSDRLNAPKRLLVRDTDDLARSLAERAFELGNGGKRVLVFCNSREKVARVVADDLRKRSAKLWPNMPTTVMLVGARRVAERDRLTGRRTPGGEEWEVVPDPVFHRFVSGGATDRSDVPAFLVATSAGEVGVDLDADHMVCDLVAWERMVQRLGRVNRTGRTEPALVDVFAAVPKDDAEDDVKEQLGILRAPFESALWPCGDDGRRQAGPAMLRELQKQPGFAPMVSAATTPHPLRPELTEALVDAWAMTSLEHHTGRPEIGPWLRGWVTDVPRARIVWRSHLPVRDGGPDPTLLTELFQALPPHLTEILETEAFRIAEVLSARSVAISALLRQSTMGANYRPLHTLAAVVLDSRGKAERPLSLKELTDIGAEDFAGKTIVVDAKLGGLSPDGLLEKMSVDIPRTLDAAGDGPHAWGEARLREVGRRFRVVSVDDDPIDGWVREAAWPTSVDDEDGAAKEWRVERLLSAVTDGDTARSRTVQALREHLSWCAEEVDRLAAALGLSDEMRWTIQVVAASHDLGKDRELWQTAMGAPRTGRPYAKTDGRRADGRALGGYRHEFGSLRDAERALSELKDEDLRDLARHLIASHHGFARPVISAIDPDEPPSLAAERSQHVALRFAGLQRKWGAWGLAWWESLIRASDWAASNRALPVDGNGGMS